MTDLSTSHRVTEDVVMVMRLPQMTGGPWLPTWLGVTAVATFAAIVTVHLWHTVAAPLRVRMWHLAHVLMALGMIVMFLPVSGMVVAAGVGEVVFAVAAVAAGGFVIVELARGGPVRWLWLIIGVDLAAMVYMFALPSTPLEWLTIALVVWFALQILGWVTGRLGTLAAEDHRGGGSPGTEPARRRTVAAATPAARSGRSDRQASSGTTADGAASRPHHPQLNSVALRVTLIVMSLGMAYMLAVMQFGMSNGMPGMEMPGM